MLRSSEGWWTAHQVFEAHARIQPRSKNTLIDVTDVYGERTALVDLLPFSKKRALPETCCAMREMPGRAQKRPSNSYAGLN